MSSVGALYVHIPFCVRKCSYCDFASGVPQGDRQMRDYVHGVLNKLNIAEELGLLQECKTAYIGGGTPSMLGPELLGALIQAVRRCCPSLGELTFEANPDSLGDELLEAAVTAGATRVSVGVQSLNDNELKQLGRVHDAQRARQRVRAAVAAGIDVSVDLMCATPCQTDESFGCTLCEVVDLGAQHVSVYPLSIEDATPFGQRFGSTEQPWNSEDVQADRMEQAERILVDAGFVRYEVASYAWPGFDCAHNQAYWTGIPYLGLGTGAASMLEPQQYDLARRLYNWLPPMEADTARIRFSTLDREAEFLNKREAWAEDLMLGMRLVRGVEATRIPPDVVESLAARGLVTIDAGRVVPTHNGWLLGNELFGALWDLAEER